MTASFLAPPMRDREQRHRRMVLGGVGALVLLSLSPIFGHHLAARVDAAVIGQDHVWGMCLIALHLLVEPIHIAFHALLIAGLAYAIWDRGRAWLRVRQALAWMPGPVTAVPHAGLQHSRRRAGLTSGQVRVVEGLPNPAFTAGFLRPTVFICRTLLDTLSTAELTAVLQHEARHVHRRDPLRLSLLRFVACTLFWIPAFRRLAADVADEIEIAADDAAARENPLVLASAILALAAWRDPARRASVNRLSAGDVTGLVSTGSRRGSGAFDTLLERRIRRLAGESAPVATRLTRRSLLGAALTLGLVWSSGVIVAHPMPGSAHAGGAAHCDHGDAPAFSHLFCLRDAVPSATGVVECPHRHPE